MAANIQASFRAIVWRVRAPSNGQTGDATKDNGKMESSMVGLVTAMAKEGLVMASGLRVKEKGGSSPDMFLGTHCLPCLEWSCLSHKRTAV
mmetsp:Transcript_65905/g.121535  ORF Transcript_65905/g.121535 Transcript_65905/m.121535 type:complete len:91 (+) Transcript_65905:741-1013(+)